MFPTPRTPPTHGHANHSPVPADLRTAAPSRLTPSIGRTKQQKQNMNKIKTKNNI